jgi:quinol monooxygenase YgiN
MIEIHVDLTLREGKSHEFFLTLQELDRLNRQASGYLGADIHRHPDDQNRLTVLLCWQTRRDAEQYQQSYAFAILRGALRVLTVSSQIELQDSGSAPVVVKTSVAEMGGERFASRLRLSPFGIKTAGLFNQHIQEKRRVPHEAI